MRITHLTHSATILYNFYPSRPKFLSEFEKHMIFFKIVGPLVALIAAAVVVQGPLAARVRWSCTANRFLEWVSGISSGDPERFSPEYFELFTTRRKLDGEYDADGVRSFEMDVPAHVRVRALSPPLHGLDSFLVSRGLDERKIDRKRLFAIVFVEQLVSICFCVFDFARARGGIFFFFFFFFFFFNFG
jgi:hypothetical protein